MSPARASPLTLAADEAIALIEELVKEVILELAPAPLGFETVPASSRRGIMEQYSRALAEGLEALSEQYGPQAVWELLGEKHPDGGSILERLEQKLGRDVMQEGLRLFASAMSAKLETPASEQFLGES